MRLVIVESPNKVAKIQSFLGEGYLVMASFGHIRDLPKDGGLAITFKDDHIKPKYTLRAREDSMRRMKDAASRADEVLLATDPDREGEAIAWHLTQVLGKRNYKRVTFHAITKDEVLKAVQAPRAIDQHLVDAQQARRVLDRVVGWVVSPTCASGTGDRNARSAGRVQSVALRLVVERELEISNFQSINFWSIKVHLTAPVTGQPFEARLVKWDSNEVRLGILKEDFATVIASTSQHGEWKVQRVETRRVRRAPPAPFTTATCQQALSVRLGLSPEDSMRILQGLFEAGAITYHRTDSVSLTPEAISMARDCIHRMLGPKYVPEQPNTFSSKSANTQEAHEAIRPTHPETGPLVHGTDMQGMVYRLIWERFVACQMAVGEDDVTIIEMLAAGGRALYRAKGRVLVFDGWRKLGDDATDERAEAVRSGAEEADQDDKAILPALKEGDEPQCQSVTTHRGQTKPSPRYSQASLVKKLDHDGIGRPSTYATIMKGLIERHYIKETKKRLVATDTGIKLIQFLRHAYEGNFIEQGFTAEMEALLDRIARGEADWEHEITAVSQELVRRAMANGLRDNPLAA